MNQDKKTRYNFLDWLRFIGVSLIVYDHLGPLRNSDWFVSRIIETVVNAPLGIIQYFGAFGVCLFFIISGFCLTASATTGWEFLYKKTVRIVVTLFISTILFYCVNIIVTVIAGQTYWSQFVLLEWLESSVLLCYALGKDSVINGATWYLFPLMGVYFLSSVFYGVLKRNPVCFAALLDIIFAGICLLAEWNKFQIIHMQWLVFMLVPVFGILIRSLYDKRISVFGFLTMFSVNYIVLLKTIMIFRYDYYIKQPYLISLAYAILIFGIFLLLENQIVIPKIVKFVSDISFSLYLLHMPFGGLIMTTLGKTFNFTTSFLVSVSVIGVLAWFHNMWIEKKLITGLLRKKTKV